MTLATVVPSKSTGMFAARRVVEFLEEIGCRTGDLIMKTDQEPAIRVLVADVCKARAAEGAVGRIIEEMSPKGSSSSNGVVERAVQECRAASSYYGLCVGVPMGKYLTTPNLDVDG